ncbi:MAG: Rrf2 family transcriptional regulator [Clostridia bacterium]|nr:Rrf2 family transcriptional regulator [Clostridia bacterium]
MTAEFIVAVHSLVYLNHKGDYRSSEEIAENVCTNPARVRKVMQKLKKAGLVETHAGFVGGYRFAKKADAVTLNDVFSAVGKHVVKMTWRSGSPDMDCPIATGMRPFMDELFASLDDCCTKRLEETTVADIDKRLFGGKTPA